MKSLAIFFGVSLLSCCLAGCGVSLPSVRGNVSLDGKPLDHGIVAFQAAESGAMGVANIQEDGSYSVTTGTDSGLAPGAYLVSVTAYKTKPHPDGVSEPLYAMITPARYNDPKTSGFQVEVKPGKNTFVFALEAD